MLPVDLFRRPVFALSVAAATCVHAAEMITLITLPFYFQYVEGMSPIEIGLLITPWPAVLVVVGPLAGRLSDRYPAGFWGSRPRRDDRRVAAGAVHAGARGQVDIAWRMAVCGTGFGFFQSPNNRLLIGSAPPDRAGAGSGMVSTARLVGPDHGQRAGRRGVRPDARRATSRGPRDACGHWSGGGFRGTRHRVELGAAGEPVGSGCRVGLAGRASGRCRNRSRN